MSKERRVKRIKLLLLPLLVLFSILTQQPCICSDSAPDVTDKNTHIVRAFHLSDVCSDCGHERSCDTHRSTKFIAEGFQPEQFKELVKFIAISLDEFLSLADAPVIDNNRAILDKQLYSSLKVYLLKRSLLI